MNIIKAINSVNWTYTIVVLLLAVGVLYTLGLKFPQIRFFKDIFRSVFKHGTKKTDGVSSFAAVCTAIGGQVGTGNIAGVATAIASGGPGAVFWMWVIGFLGMGTLFAEAVLAQLFRKKTDDGTYVGGPAYYLSQGVGGSFGKALGVFISIIMVLACGFIVSPLQVNSIAGSFAGILPVPSVVIGIFFAVLTGFVIFGGIKRISGLASYLVPFMAILYLVIAFICVIANISAFPGVIKLVVQSAFGAKAAAGGALGFTVQQAFRYGCARGMFSNEAGEGTTPAAHAAANVKHPAAQGMAGMFSVLVDTLVVCTATAFTILCSGSHTSGLGDISLTQLAISSVIGNVGPYIIAICMCLFAWTSSLANIFYGETCIRWLNVKNKTLLTAYRLICVLLLVAGATISAGDMWELADFINTFLVLPNGIGLLLMSPLVIAVAKDYQKQRKAGISEPVWDYEKDPGRLLHKRKAAAEGLAKEE